MSDPIDAPDNEASAGHGASAKSAAATHIEPSSPYNARSLSAMMHRETSLRASVRPAVPPACAKNDRTILGGIYLAPKMASALMAMLQGGDVTAQERAALLKAALLRPDVNFEVSAPHTAQNGVWAGMSKAANSNEVMANPKCRGVVPLHPNRLIDRAENHVLRKLGLASFPPEEPS